MASNSQIDAGKGRHHCVGKLRTGCTVRDWRRRQVVRQATQPRTVAITPAGRFGRSSQLDATLDNGIEPGTLLAPRGDEIMSLADLRRDYARAGLDEADVDADPIRQFALWFEEARAVTGHEPNAMTVATVDADGTPAARILLLKGFDERGFVFYTNYESAKGRELAANPRVALLFYWPELERQVRISGVVQRVSRDDSARYFHSRPRGSQIGSAVSRQSEVIPNREVLIEAVAQLEAAYDGAEIPLPDFWGGYRAVPTWLEFWQGRPSRLHDRLRYLRDDGGWRIVRLSP
jgi:pyridoxamine 5'-phosphate oxidase